ncbi:glycine oxidase [Micromonospora pattaloongensis]|uniref:glycine oxidase n=1 Tax=Micromonospora pattaloongensis TaxID=405436 RepID=A0A1H3MIZ5_9ACTN|nr:glycine oxidase ThiO [Micromonospora pattaloongensis]SDY76546.1 glycine oxidase [Micromonospora pattaloongensis]
MNATADVAVVGAGPIGLAVAWRCAQRGLRVTVYDPAPGSGASAVAAGMLAPVAEAYFGEVALTGLLVESAARWPRFAAELSTATGMSLGYRTEGTLVVALTGDDLAEAERLWTYQQRLGLPITPLRPAALREREPLLAPRARGGAYAPGDHQVDPRRLVAALRAALDRCGVPVVARHVDELSTIEAGTVVVAAGCGAGPLTGLPIRPVKGQVLRLRTPGGGAPGFRHVIRGYADGRHVYLVPRADGEVVVGATVEERGDRAVTAGAVLELLRAAADLIPEIAEYELVEARAALRPGTPDNAPALGRLPGRPGVVVATGHYRHGIVLTPVTAELIADLVATGAPDPALAPFAPERFGAREAVAQWS